MRLPIYGRLVPPRHDALSDAGTPGRLTVDTVGTACG